jgi:hypothetical protein
VTTRIRKQIYIESDQEILLKRLSNERGISEAEIIRQAITQHVLERRAPFRDPRAWAAERKFITGLIEQGPVAGERTWRREDLYER